jgi:GBP family porin
VSVDNFHAEANLMPKLLQLNMYWSDTPMKKTLMVAAVTGLFASGAYAQSSVTLYGLIDAGITFTNNKATAPGVGHTAYLASSGNLNNNRWGLRGTEDLGGGLKAIFVLEDGFNIDTGKFGQGGREFGRQAFVGLSSNQYGAVTLGRQYDSVVDYLAPLALTGSQYGGTQFAHPFDNDNLNNSFRIDNSIKYTSANYGGFKFGGLYGFSNTAGQFANNRAYSVGASYNYGPFNAAAAYMELNNVGVGATGAVDGSAASGDSTFVAGLQRTFGGGVNYAYGPATVGVVFTQTHLFNAQALNSNGTTTTIATSAQNASLRFNNYELNAKYQFTPALSLSGAYTYTQGAFSGPGTVGTLKPKWNQFSLLSDYALSKRTDVYLEGVYQKTSGAGGTFLNGATITGVGQSADDKQVAVTAGIRHRF